MSQQDHALMKMRPVDERVNLEDPEALGQTEQVAEGRKREKHSSGWRHISVKQLQQGQDERDVEVSLEHRLHFLGDLFTNLLRRQWRWRRRYTLIGAGVAAVVIGYKTGFPGPAGSVMLNGAAMKQEAQVEIDKLEKELQNLVTSGEGYAFVIG